MKRLVLTTSILLLLVSLGMAQTQYPTWSGGVAAPNQEKRIAMYCPTEGDYVPLTLTTNNDTSAAYVIPPFAEAWVLTKPVSVTADQDSVDIVVYLQGKFTDELITGYTTRANGWFNMDSSHVATGDTLGGDLKKMIIPPGIDQVRIVWDGITGNDVNAGTTYSSWIILKY